MPEPTDPAGLAKPEPRTGQADQMSVDGPGPFGLDAKLRAADPTAGTGPSPQDRELVPAEAGDQVVRSHAALEPCGELDEQGVALVVTE